MNNMEIISNMIEQSENAICYITIFDEHVIKNLITIYGQDKTVSIILEGKKYDSKFQIIDRFKQLICHFEFHPKSGLLMKAYAFNDDIISENNSSFQDYLKGRSLNKYKKDIENIKRNPSDKSNIKIIKPEEYFFSKLK